jgi:hypothetical protein
MPGRDKANAAATLELVGRMAGLKSEATHSPHRWDAARRTAVADMAGSVAAESIQAARDLVAAAVDAQEMTARDRRELAGAARDCAVVAGILIDKANLITGLATSRVERVDADELRRRLSVLLSVDSVPLAPPDALPIEAHVDVASDLR